MEPYLPKSVEEKKRRGPLIELQGKGEKPALRTLALGLHYFNRGLHLGLPGA